MNILLVNKINKSEEIIFAECNEDILIKLENYRINMNKCKNNHNQGEKNYKK